MVPWWLPAETGAGTFRAPRTTEVEAAAPWLDRLFSLLPDLRIVMALGRPAQRGLDRYAQARQFRYTTIAAPHPGNRAWNQPTLRTSTHAAFASLSQLLRDKATGDHPRRIDHWP
ncbi:MAG: hypothetical protein H0U48_04590 [Euzebyaceae bacterium]|nr:hypothetical protein [Euzebyaceae bacterium]